MYTIHPTNEALVLTPDDGVIECKHVAAAMRVIDELNALYEERAKLRATIMRLTDASEGAVAL